MNTLAEFIMSRLDEDEAMAGQQRALRDIQAKRAIVAAHAPVPRRPPHGDVLCASCGGEGVLESVDWPCLTVLVIAATWNDHPDYESAWAPGSAIV